ncbi:MAG: hypothetical protein WAK40_07260 [Thermoplasmata archaeon]
MAAIIFTDTVGYTASASADDGAPSIPVQLKKLNLARREFHRRSGLVGTPKLVE